MLISFIVDRLVSLLARDGPKQHFVDYGGGMVPEDAGRRPMTVEEFFEHSWRCDTWTMVAVLGVMALAVVLICAATWAWVATTCRRDRRLRRLEKARAVARVLDDDRSAGAVNLSTVFDFFFNHYHKSSRAC